MRRAGLDGHLLAAHDEADALEALRVGDADRDKGALLAGLVAPRARRHGEDALHPYRGAVQDDLVDAARADLRLDRALGRELVREDDLPGRLAAGRLLGAPLHGARLGPALLRDERERGRADRLLAAPLARDLALDRPKRPLARGADAVGHRERNLQHEQDAAHEEQLEAQRFPHHAGKRGEKG